MSHLERVPLRYSQFPRLTPFPCRLCNSTYEYHRVCFNPISTADIASPCRRRPINVLFFLASYPIPAQLKTFIPLDFSQVGLHCQRVKGGGGGTPGFFTPVVSYAPHGMIVVLTRAIKVSKVLGWCTDCLPYSL